MVLAIVLEDMPEKAVLEWFTSMGAPLASAGITKQGLELFLSKDTG